MRRKVRHSDDSAPAPSAPIAPIPGSPEFRALVERHKDAIERETGVRPEYILDIGIGDMPGYGKAESADDEAR